jgi:hypothetical protein
MILTPRALDSAAMAASRVYFCTIPQGATYIFLALVLHHHDWQCRRSSIQKSARHIICSHDRPGLWERLHTGSRVLDASASVNQSVPVG